MDEDGAELEGELAELLGELAELGALLAAGLLAELVAGDEAAGFVAGVVEFADGAGFAAFAGAVALVASAFAGAAGLFRVVGFVFGGILLLGSSLRSNSSPAVAAVDGVGLRWFAPAFFSSFLIEQQ